MNGQKAVRGVWRDEEKSSVQFIDRTDGTMYMLTVHAPGADLPHWTAQAELLGPDYRQLSFSGLHHGGTTRDEAKVVAESVRTRLAA
ncbi:hypothetical protein [Mycolicibacterium houstonense]|uniref:hypothetical protein n=1 Tax=Mycolicibacterium houstonense TaxID=146021 RepID=UPI000A3F1A6E|nr:hypothetical protein [Mycolicibacterium houstonense]